MAEVGSPCPPLIERPSRNPLVPSWQAATRRRSYGIGPTMGGAGLCACARPIDTGVSSDEGGGGGGGDRLASWGLSCCPILVGGHPARMKGLKQAAVHPTGDKQPRVAASKGSAVVVARALQKWSGGAGAGKAETVDRTTLHESTRGGDKWWNHVKWKYRESKCRVVSFESGTCDCFVISDHHHSEQQTEEIVGCLRKIGRTKLTHETLSILTC